MCIMEDGSVVGCGAICGPSGDSAMDQAESGLVDCPFDRELPPRRGGRVARRVRWQVVRVLRVPGDLPLLFERHPRPRKTLKQIRHSHHQLARLLAEGVAQEEAGLITGYSPSYISVMKTDEAFQGLIQYYVTQREIKFVDVVDRMRSLGLSTLDELQARLDSEPEEWTRRELMEMAELMLVKPAAARTPLVQNNLAPVSVNVRFVTANHEPLREPKDVTPATAIEHQPLEPLPGNNPVPGNGPAQAAEGRPPKAPP